MSPRRRNYPLALGFAGVAAGATAFAAYRAARKYRNLELDMSELALPDGLTRINVTVDDGATIHGVEIGEGRPIVLLHGVTLSVATWPYQLRKLSEDYRVIALDARGHGDTECNIAGATMGRLASDVAQVMSHLDLRDAIVVGHSMGGMMTQQMCLDFPDLAKDRIAGTILLSTAAAPAASFPGGPRLGRQMRGGRYAGKGRTVPPAEIGYALARLALGAHPDPRFVAHTRDMSGAVPAHIAGEVLPFVVGFDVRSRLKDYPVPALVISGSRDLLTPPRAGKDLATRIPNAQFEVVPGGGHMLMMERAGWLNERIDKFARNH
ncbi:MAG: alpha/beta hydrolase [Acidimicrobiales bacterium]|nr:alpha/beta hydrolase [Acidimicrobiales bacterium]